MPRTTVELELEDRRAYDSYVKRTKWRAKHHETILSVFFVYVLTTLD